MQQLGQRHGLEYVGAHLEMGQVLEENKEEDDTHGAERGERKVRGQSHRAALTTSDLKVVERSAQR